MKYLRIEDCAIYEGKTVENYNAANLLIEKQFYNAASSRIYYSLIQLALRNASKYELSKDIYTREDPKNGIEIDKSAIEQNAWGLRINDCKNYRYALNRARTTRIKADYLKENVIFEEIEEFFPGVASIITAEGITL